MCESSDFLGLKRKLGVEVNDLLVIKNAGAYGFSLSSNYNSRLRPAEILVDKKKVKLIRKRDTYADLWMNENHEI